MPREAPFLRAVGAVLFTAVCAYALARFMTGAANHAETVEVMRRSVVESTALEGIVLRRETALNAGAEDSAYAAGERIDAAAASALSGEKRASSLFFPNCDGYEYLTPSLLNGLTAEGLEELLSAKPMERAAARLVEGFDWYYAALSGDTELECGEYKLCFAGFSESASAELISNADGVLAFRLSDASGEYMSLRFAKAELILKRAEGLCVPPDAVETDADGKSFVYRRGLSGDERAKVEIIYETDSFCLISPGGEIHEGEVLVRNRRDK